MGVQRKLWLTIRNMYSQAHSVMKWNRKTPMPFVIKQSVRQSGIPSTLHYKLLNNNLLFICQKMHVGMAFGLIDCCDPTCADDVVFVALATLLTTTTYAVSAI